MAWSHSVRGNSGLERHFVRHADLDRAYSASMGGIVTNSSSPRCYGRRCHDLTPVIPGLPSWSTQERWWRHRGVSSAPMGERHQRPVSGEPEIDDVIPEARTRQWWCCGLACACAPALGLGRVGDVPRPLVWGLGWSGEMGWYAHAACWRPSKWRVSLLISLVDFFLNGVD
jgi:hypothetical protein